MVEMRERWMMEVNVRDSAGWTRLMDLGSERQDTLSVCWNPGTCTETAGRAPEGDPVGSTTDRLGSHDTGSWEAPCLSHLRSDKLVDQVWLTRASLRAERVGKQISPDWLGQ